MTPDQHPGFSLFRRLLREARAYWPHLAVILVLSLLAPALKLLSPIPLKFAVDGVIGGRPQAVLG
jgi:hypothetical protein